MHWDSSPNLNIFVLKTLSGFTEKEMSGFFIHFSLSSLESVSKTETKQYNSEMGMCIIERKPETWKKMDDICYTSLEKQ